MEKDQIDTFLSVVALCALHNQFCLAAGLIQFGLRLWPNSRRVKAAAEGMCRPSY